MLAAISIVPLGTGESVGDQVAEAVRIIRDSGLPSETNAMFTNVEGEWDEIMPAIRACLDKISESAPRVTVFLKLAVRSGEAAGRLQRDVESIERRLG